MGEVVKRINRIQQTNGFLKKRRKLAEAVNISEPYEMKLKASMLAMEDNSSRKDKLKCN